MLRALLTVAVLILLLAVAYAVLTEVARRNAIRRLEAEHAEGRAPALTREDYVARGLARHERQVPRRTILLIFAAPVVLLAVIIYLAG